MLKGYARGLESLAVEGWRIASTRELVEIVASSGSSSSSSSIRSGKEYK